MCIVDQMLVATLVNPHNLDVHSISLQQHNEEQAKATLSPPLVMTTQQNYSRMCLHFSFCNSNSSSISNIVDMVLV
jgi:hypothetical protein